MALFALFPFGAAFCHTLEEAQLSHNVNVLAQLADSTRNVGAASRIDEGIVRISTVAGPCFPRTRADKAPATGSQS